MKKISLIIASVVFITVGGNAQSTPKKEAIKQLFGIMHQDSLMGKMMKDMSGMMASSMITNMKSMNMTDTSFASRTKIMAEKNMEATKSIIAKMVNEDMVDVYDKYFTMQEIQDFTAFYKSKSGQQLLNKTPDVTKDLMMIMSTKYGAELREAMMKSMQ